MKVSVARGPGYSDRIWGHLSIILPLVGSQMGSVVKQMKFEGWQRSKGICAEWRGWKGLKV